MWPSQQGLLVYHLLYLASLATAQNMAATTTTPVALLKRQNGLSLLSSSAMPSPSDDAPGGNGKNPNPGDSSSLVNYYFGFLALIVCAVGLFIFIFFRRRHRMMRLRAGQRTGLGGNTGGSRHNEGWANWNPERRQHWQGRWHSREASREEGLNEYGEAPPVYMPKPNSEEREREGQGDGPAIPLQTLSREDAGLKPPDYSEVHVQGPTSDRRASTASASTSHMPERPTNP